MDAFADNLDLGGEALGDFLVLILLFDTLTETGASERALDAPLADLALV